MDFEYLDGLSIAQINEISLAFLQELSRITGKELVLYSDAYNARAVFDRRLAEAYPLWVAQYGVETPEDNGKWSSWVGFQYSSTGRVAGIRGNVDLNRFTTDIFCGRLLPHPSRRSLRRKSIPKLPSLPFAPETPSGGSHGATTRLLPTF